MDIRVDGKENKNGLLKMLAWIEYCGNIGHTPKYLKVYIDGDGATRFKFNFNDKEQQEKYKEIKQSISENFNRDGRDMEYIEL